MRPITIPYNDKDWPKVRGTLKQLKDNMVQTADPQFDLSTEDVVFVDAGSAGATEQDWIEVTVGGVTGYIRVYATK